jgi:hypothetical protein
MLPFGDRQLDQTLGFKRHTVHIGHIALQHLALREQAAQGAMQFGRQRHQDQTGGVAIEAMHQLGLRPMVLDPRDQRIGQGGPQAGLAEQARGLVERDQIIAVVHDPGGIQRLSHHQRPGHGRCGLTAPH